MTIWQYLTWPGLSKDVINYVNNCNLYKIYKATIKNYGHLPPKTIEEEIPQHALYVDLIGPYTITDKAGLNYTLWAMTFIDPATGWFKVAKTHTKTTKYISKLLDRVQLCYYS